jgi:hypothetical protein
LGTRSIDRASSNGEESGRALRGVLTWLNDHESDSFVVCTANNVRVLPPEFSRAERFDGVFFLDLPSRNTVSHMGSLPEAVGPGPAATASQGRGLDRGRNPRVLSTGRPTAWQPLVSHEGSTCARKTEIGFNSRGASGLPAGRMDRADHQGPLSTALRASIWL